MGMGRIKLTEICSAYMYIYIEYMHTVIEIE